MVLTDAFGTSVGGVLSQEFEGKELPIALYDRKLSDTERRWPARDQELYAIKLCIAKWRLYLHGTKFVVFTDNSACKWLKSRPQVSGRLARWLDFFAEYDFELIHRPGKENVVADALLRQEINLAYIQMEKFKNTLNSVSRRDMSLIYGIQNLPKYEGYEENKGEKRMVFEANNLHTELEKSTREKFKRAYKEYEF
ncbi:retrotransposable element tf2 kda protein type 1 [Plasmopara halstedii]|uniref:Retrotransposable element tf2 kDa protein type 1 n=1 Tax=Plasmopara halstedii TaxID=4781 RepID=A0A0P1ABK3_PLAHL|nr:retrotransposable element tf2 kda protein type 1 [Plasmopara halstedii]CEG37676.1 retrotransposable element tf2 kda protein type 1 [Plasmopara halstedii]|eukprot:XP_024574045.1 retrotransposable element tf2 kda protein type 1 [Plasmopara halstedii]